MVKLTKTPLPENIIIKSEHDYRSEVVFGILCEDCYDKCYICEIKPTTINVEHLEPHLNDPNLKYDWSNLFVACGHCNGIKSTNYIGFINPTKCDPEQHIELSHEPNLSKPNLS